MRPVRRTPGAADQTRPVTGLPSATDAAHNNAAWCDAICRAHGATGVFTPAAWSTPSRSPRAYPDAVTLAADRDEDALLRRVDTSAGCSIKDSFATLDLAPAGFRVLFDATWIGCAAPAGAAHAWQPVTDPEALREWEVAWAAPDAPTGLFPPALLSEPGVVVLGDRAGGAVLNHAAGWVGVSNLFARAGDADAAWRAVLAAARERISGVPIVGYETGDDLAIALRNGFNALGPLRVWKKD
jgi:hypothetical protein